MKKLKRSFQVINYFVIFYIAKIGAMFYLIFNKRNLFVFTERGIDAHDNGYVMYNYFKEKGYPCKYIIDKKSDEAKKINKEDLIEFLSWKHYFLIHTAKYLITTHATNYLGIFSSKNVKLYRVSTKVIFLQHGVIKNDHPNLHKGEFKCNMFLTSTDWEYNFIKDKFNYPESIVKNLGLPRFDFLKDISNDKDKIILVMPTWRIYLNNLSDIKFKNSIFFKKYKELLVNKELLDYCRINKYKIVFSMHSEMIKYLDLFKECESDVVSISKEDTQYELKRSNVLITDYSSVYFDFAYMLKPVIYYQFDQEDFERHHYKKGYFDYYDNGFGDVDIFLSQVIKSLKNIDKYKDTPYYKRELKCFKNRNDNHRQLVMEEILKI